MQQATAEIYRPAQSVPMPALTLVSPSIPWAGRQPRAWQRNALPLILDALRRRERTLVNAIMGSGKSVLLAEVCASGRGRVLVTVPTQRLVEQMFATIDERLPGQVGQYFQHQKDCTKRITVACVDSIPALLADKEWPGSPALLILDEAHGCQAETVLDAYEKLQPQRILGFTATPFRADEKEELSLFDREVFVYGVADALRDRVIVPFRVRHWTGGSDVHIDDACIMMIRDTPNAGPGLVNAKSISDAETFSKKLTDYGIKAMPIHSRLRKDTIAETLDRLRDGALDAIVHVNMLSEGVDFPWLRWLCMRRIVGSRVRFCQEVGRILRASPGKDYAILLDPHDLMGAFALNYEAILAGGCEEPEQKPFEKELRECQVQDEREDSGQPSPKRLAAWRRYLRTLYLTAMSAGLFESRVKSTQWRKYDPSEKQVAAVRKLVPPLANSRTTPKAHGDQLLLIAQHAESLTRGDASDFLSLAFAALEARKEKKNFWEMLKNATNGT